MKTAVRNLTCFLLLTGAAFAQNSFVSAWMNDGSPMSDADVSSIISAVGTQQANPDHIAIMVHGLGNSREASTGQFNDLVPRLAPLYQKGNKKVAFVGMQWNSDAPMGLFSAESSYFDMLARARKVGHWPARQVLLAMQKQYPNAKYDVYCHSLGCEVTAAMIAPEIKYTDEVPKSEVFAPDQDIRASTVIMAGSDLDFDVWAKSGIPGQKNPRVQQFWLTVSPYIGEAERDGVLNLRAIVRGRAAGNSFPLMTEKQLDVFLGGKHMVIDNENIPADHAFLNYFSQARLDRIVPLALHIGDPSLPKPAEFDELEQVSAMPDNPAALTPFLESKHLTTVMYTLWRLEKSCCGGPKHLADGSIDEMVQQVKKKPATVRGLCKEASCEVMKKGYFPTESMLIRAGAPNW